jgi:hypothetical protein
VPGLDEAQRTQQIDELKWRITTLIEQLRPITARVNAGENDDGLLKENSRLQGEIADLARRRERLQNTGDV